MAGGRAGVRAGKRAGEGAFAHLSKARQPSVSSGNPTFMAWTDEANNRGSSAASARLKSG